MPHSIQTAPVESLRLFPRLASRCAFVLALGRGEGARAVTIAFMTLALAQGFHLGNARSTAAVLGRRHVIANWWALGAVLLAVVLQIVAVYAAGLARVLRVVPLTVADWAIVLTAAVAPAIVGQAIKLVRSGRRKPHDG